MKILYVGMGEFDSLPEHYHQLQHLRARGHVVSYLGLTSRENLVGDSDGVRHLRYKGPVTSRIYLAFALMKIVRHAHKDIVVVPYFKGCSLFAMICREATVDIRTVSVNRSLVIRVLENLLISVESMFFTSGFVIAEDVKEELRLPTSFVVSPQGAEQPEVSVNKSWERLRLLYVGALHNRNLHEFVEGLGCYVAQQAAALIDDFVIIGHGPEADKDRLLDAIRAAGLPMVRFIGEIRHPELQEYLDAANVGVSYVPVTTYFNLQPVTKTSEYRLNGMAVLATATRGNARIVGERDGVIHKDNPWDVSAAIGVLVQRRASFDSVAIRSRAQSESWSEIVKNVVEPCMLDIVSARHEQSE
jgi:hypothetical protein